MYTYGLIDIDDFGKFNLANSFERGNKLLIELAEMSQKSISPIYFKRLDSDEFLFVLSGNFESNSSHLITFLQKCSLFLKFSISIGVSEKIEKVKFKTIVPHLRNNLLIAKMNGKNKICVL